RMLGRSTRIQATGRFLRQQLWAWPIIAAVLFGGAGWWVHYSVENAMRQQRATDLNVMVDASVTSVKVWMSEQRTNVELIADGEALRSLVAKLAPLADGSPQAERKLVEAKSQEALRAQLKPKLRLMSGYVGYFVVGREGVVVAADENAPIGKALV